MLRKLLYILFLALTVPTMAIEVPCGTWLELRATAFDDWHFERWSDGYTEPVRQIEVLDNVNFIAYFAPNCGDYAALPIVSLYEWLLMLDVRTIQSKGYLFSPENVTWYRVRGVPDKLEDGASADDEICGTGYYLTIDRSLIGTGDYYAIVDMSYSPSGVLCNGLMRSELIHYSSAEATERRVPVLEPTFVHAGEEQRLLHLNPANETKVTVSDMAGRTIQQLKVDGTERMTLYAAPAAGSYQVTVINGTEKYVLRYMVVK